MVRIRRSVVFEYMALEAVEGDRTQVSRWHDAIGIQIVAAER
jgi:hypothetical protein